jgi:hypothetical protein
LGSSDLEFDGIYWERNPIVSLDNGYTISAMQARATRSAQKFGGPRGLEGTSRLAIAEVTRGRFCPKASSLQIRRHSASRSISGGFWTAA